MDKLDDSMNKHLKALGAAAVASALGTSGCENMTAGENALVAAGLAGTATAIALGTTGVPVGSTLPISLGAAAGAGALGYGVSKMQVSRDQRIFAEQRGQAVVAAARQRGNYNLPRYILVDTFAEKPSGGRPVMMFDTATGRVASNRIYYVNAAEGSRGYVEAPAGMVGDR